MTSIENEAMRRLRSLSECCICLTTYTDPRMLPCFHTACLKCFEDFQLKTGKKPGEVLPCPLCRNEFLIPAIGMKGLQMNFFIKSLMEVTSAFDTGNKSGPCDIYSADEDVKDVTEATMRCLNCRENYCLRCSKMHKIFRGSKDHKIVQINTEVNDEEIRNMFPIRKCARHSDKVLDYYCSVCKTVVCVSCFVEEHQTHKCKDVTTVDNEFRQRIEQSVTEICDHKEDILSRKSDLGRKKRDLLAKVLETESAIRKKNQELKALIDQHTEELLNELSLLKQQQEKKMDTEIEEIERKLTVHDSFVIYCIELKSKGSPSEVCGSVDSLIARAKKLRKEYDKFLRAPSKPFDFEFIATDHDAGNIIGKLSESTKEFNRCDVVIANDEAAIRLSLNRPDFATAIEPLPDKFQFGATAATAAVYRNTIFVCGLGNTGKDIWRLDASSSKWNKCASLIQGKRYHSVAFVGHVLYICGGCLSTNWKPLDDVETYNTYDDKCSKVGKLAYAVFCSGNCVPYKASLYIFGGYDANTKDVSTVQVYDTKLNNCTLLTQKMPRAGVWLRCELWKNSAILLNNDGCLIYDFYTQKWKVRDEIIKLENVYSSVIGYDGKLFVIGCGVKQCYVIWIPVSNFLNDELIEWRCHAKLPTTYIDNGFSFAKLEYSV